MGKRIIARTHSLRARDIQRDWHVIDASGQVLGRLAAHVAILLQGKHKPAYSPHLDMGDSVVIVNAEKVMVTGKKLQQKMYYRHSGYPGGLRETSLGRMLKTKPALVIEHAVKGMLSHNRLGRSLARHLKVYAGPGHPHEAQIDSKAKEG